LEHAVESFLNGYAGIFSLSKTKIRSAAENKNFKDIKVLKLCVLAFLVLTEDFNVMTFVDACSTAL
jgi:hypothetical protein